MENPLFDLDAVERIADPKERALEIGRRLGMLPEFQERMRRMRQVAVLEMRAAGMSFGAIAKDLGLHRNRVQQIAEGRPGGGKGAAKVEP